jgi:hypothetical protein
MTTVPGLEEERLGDEAGKSDHDIELVAVGGFI